MRTRYLFSTCLLTALLVSGFALPFQAEAWNGDYHYGYRHPRLNFSFRFGYPIYPSMGYYYYPHYRPYYRYHPYRYPYRHFHPWGHPYSYPYGGFYWYRY